MKIYALRHGQTDLNAKGGVQGCKSDLTLNNEGKKQAKEAAKALSSKGIDLIITSPLKRAVETTDIIAEHLKIGQNKIVKGMSLYERDFGDYEGKFMSEVNIKTLRRWTDNVPVPNGETIREVASRVFDFLDIALERFNESTILFVVHGHVLRTMYWYFNGIPEDGKEIVIETNNCEFYEFNTDKLI